HEVAALHADGSRRPDPAVVWSSSDPAVASVDPFGSVTAHAVGEATISASFEGARASAGYAV
ncbi:MAG: hypothetical protein GWM90_26215, partial [Gemmatimonadetes bacterium]|nr:hypothetical protein [Gemmatimonadota bacterium]NIS35364.1 hypothetical protein [Actinomycetota bacterium]NIQ58384.1 hypothetical protein [Gemmatimonadota bacterium]NIU70056.1 hypothetical protein [Actinomycetota bacterium]NIW31933.1 hypothetical protein [Actinomycetota bacterium]